MSNVIGPNAMDKVEKMARKLCVADGKNPDARQTYSIQVWRGGRLTDTGHDSRWGIKERCTAPAQWQDYSATAKCLLAMAA